MTTNMNDFIRTNGELAQAVFDEIRAISASPAPGRGVTRLGYGPVETAVMARLEEKGRELGLEISHDLAGNLWMTVPGEDRTLPALVCGSHADSVFDGGNYDGLAGVAAALLAAKTMKVQGFTPKRDFCVVVLRSEEQGLIGSKAMMGKLSEEDLDRRWRPDAPTLGESIAACGIDPAPLVSGKPVVDPKRIAAFMELHIEQGVRLDMPEGPRVAIVTGIRGLVWHRTIECVGTTAHAGAIDYPYRKDALAASMAFLTHMHERWADRVARGEDLVFTTGILRTPDAGTFNKIPGYVAFSLDARSLSNETLSSFYDEYRREAQRFGEAYGVEFRFDPVGRLVAQKSSSELIGRLHRAADELAVPVIEEPSGAGHDAQTFGLEGIPFAMLFVSNQNGSHNPDEAMRMEDFLAGAAILTRAAIDFDR